MIAVLGVTVITPNPGRSFPHWLASMELDAEMHQIE